LETSTKLNKTIKDGVYYPERTTDTHNATASTVNADIDTKSDNVAIH